MTQSLLAALVVALLGLSSTACSDKGSCEQVVDRMIALMQKDRKPEQPLDATSQRAEMLAKCEEAGGVTKQQEGCVLAAKSLRDLATCDRPR